MMKFFLVTLDGAICSEVGGLMEFRKNIFLFRVTKVLGKEN